MLQFLFVLQAFALLSDKLEVLVEGVRQNREHWLQIAEEHKLLPTNNEKDSNDNVTTISKPNTPDSNNIENTSVQNCRASSPIAD